jgi:hypothetical protein
MRSRLLAVSAAVVCVLGAGAPTAFAEKLPATMDGLTLVPSKKFEAVYLLPSADFHPYTKVMLDPTEVAFEKNWINHYNDQTIDPDARIDTNEARKILDMAKAGFQDIFRKAYTDAGYQVVDTPAPDVIRVRTAVANLRVAAPDMMTAGRSATFSSEAGAATLVLEARDSMSNALLGRAIDARLAGDTAPYRRNSVSNRSDFSRLFETWAKISVDGLAELKARPAPPATAQK